LIEPPRTGSELDAEAVTRPGGLVDRMKKLGHHYQ